MSIADWSKPLGGFTVSRMSRAGRRDVAVAMRDCGISTKSQTRPFGNIAFLHSRSIKRCQWKHKLDYYGVDFAHLATGCGIKVKDLSGLDSNWWILHSRCWLKPSRDSHATSQRDSPIWIQPVGVFRYKTPSFPMMMLFWYQQFLWFWLWRVLEGSVASMHNIMGKQEVSFPRPLGWWIVLTFCTCWCAFWQQSVTDQIVWHFKF